MIDQLEALAALADCGTMTRAAVRLRISQSAVSKRIAALEDQVGATLVEPAGRRVRLTPAGLRVLERTRPLIGELRHALAHEAGEARARLVLGVSESILASWGPRVLARVRARLPGIELALNAHRSPVAIDAVRAGEYALALVAGDPEPDLASDRLGLEEMVLISHASIAPVRRGTTLRVHSIEPRSATWRSLRPALLALERASGVRIEIDATLQSFACVVQLARAGFADGLVPLGIARALGTPARRLRRLPRPGLARPLTLVGRDLTFSRPAVNALREALSDALRAEPCVIASG